MPEEHQNASGGDGDTKVLLRNPVPTFEAESFDLYLSNLEMWYHQHGRQGGDYRSFIISKPP